MEGLHFSEETEGVNGELEAEGRDWEKRRERKGKV